MKEIAVVHLVRACNGIAPFSDFLASYRSHAAEIDHDLIIAFKGFGSTDKEEYLKLLEPLEFVQMDVTDQGFDITAYFSVADRHGNQYKYFCFLNSFSVIQATGWLNQLYRQVSRPDVAVVGASGSWQSMRGSWVPLVSALKSMHSQWRSFFMKNRSGGYPGFSSLYREFRARQAFAACFDRYPNYHIRTNAFMLSSEAINRMQSPDSSSKVEMYKHESGKNGLTKQLLGTGQEALVVGRDGIGYAKEHWDASNTFWQSEQENLLVADNQTRGYQYAASDKRCYMSSMVWGSHSHVPTDRPIRDALISVAVIGGYCGLVEGIRAVRIILMRAVRTFFERANRSS